MHGTYTALIWGLGMPEILVIAAVAVLLFGGKKVGEMGKGIGEGIREFRKSFREAEDVKTQLKSEWENDPAWRELRDRHRWADLAEYERTHRI